ncbi:MAG: hypothetical protein JJ900_05740 [Rhodospirillales bacterium]|nr:hypothetical protein [Rhodospirillales bacterium]MBO6786336.1 hypothetical protein [Rhodospirillales bacterium]
MSASAFNALGISQDGLKTALGIKQSYKKREPLVIPGDEDRLLVPENLLNRDIDLSGLEDPLALAMVCSRDPEGSMALAATARLCPLGNSTKLVRGMVEIIGDTSRHDLVKECLKYVTEHAFEPDSIGKVRQHASKIVTETRQKFTAALRENLKSLLDGEIAPRQFVREFFELTEAGNLRHDIRKKLILSLLLSSSVRPSIKFLMLENFERMPKPVKLGIVSAVLKAEPTRHTEVIKEELKYLISQERMIREGHDINGRPAAEALRAPVLSAAGETVPEEFPMPLPGGLHPERPRPAFDRKR